MIWTPERLREARKLLAGGSSPKHVSALFGCTPGSLAGALWREDRKATRKVTWRKWERQQRLDFYVRCQAGDVEALAKELGITLHAVNSIAKHFERTLRHEI